VRSVAAGHNVLRYLMLRMHNQVLRPQHYRESCGRLSGLNLLYGCIPFDQMPFCTSLPGHNPRYWDLVESLDVTDRSYELLARRVRNNVERHGILYTPVADLEEFGDITELVSIFNGKLHYKHTERKLVQDKGHVFIRGTRTALRPSSRSCRSMPRPGSTATERPSSGGWPRRHAA
jgi:hypothetical protein